MEEKKKKQEQPEKLSYDELKQRFGELFGQYQKLSAEYQRAMEALNSRDFDYTSFFLSMLFKVMEHPEMYNEEFVTWTSKHIEDALYAFDNAMKQQPENKNEAE